MNANDERLLHEAEGWRQEGPQAIARGLAPDGTDDAIADESLWLALNAWA